VSSDFEALLKAGGLTAKGEKNAKEATETPKSHGQPGREFRKEPFLNPRESPVRLFAAAIGQGGEGKPLARIKPHFA
jgi:hypothetical protein